MSTPLCDLEAPKSPYEKPRRAEGAAQAIVTEPAAATITAEAMGFLVRQSETKRWPRLIMPTTAHRHRSCVTSWFSAATEVRVGRYRLPRQRQRHGVAMK
jgi:hypothetical protein